MLASAVGGLLTRTLVSSQVECVTENASVYSFYMLMWLLCDFKAKLFFFFSFFFVISSSYRQENFCPGGKTHDKGATWLLFLITCGICLICTLCS